MDGFLRVNCSCSGLVPIRVNCYNNCVSFKQLATVALISSCDFQDCVVCIIDELKSSSEESTSSKNSENMS